MALRFIAIDPETDSEHCPAVFVDEGTGDMLFQGWSVTDPATLAEVGDHSPIGDDESVVRLPARMRAIILEALNGAGAAVQRTDRGDDDAQRCTWRCGTRTRRLTRSSSSGRRARPGRCPRIPPGMSSSATHVARGVRFRRARIVSEPVADFIRFEYEATAGLNVAAGEEVRWLPRRRASDLCLPGNDFWVFDGRLVRFHHFSGDGDIVEDEMVRRSSGGRDVLGGVRGHLGARSTARRLPALLSDRVMAVSPSSSVQRARELLAARLRDIRLDAGLSARELSSAAAWHPAKTSRIESAKQAPSEDDIRVWCRVCGAEREVPDLIAASRAADSMYIEWRRLNRGGMRAMQESRRPL